MIFFWTLVGFAVGSFINVVADRLPNNQSLVSPPSHCGACGRRLTALEMVPVLSFLALRGRCRTCGAPIGTRVLWVELATGALFTLAALSIGDWRLGTRDGGPGIEDWHGLINLILTSAYLAVFVVVAVTDLEHGLILDKVIWPATVFALFGTLIANPQAWLAHLLSGAMGAGVIALIILLVPQGMGWGDARLAGLVGLVAGWPGVGFALFTAFVSGGIVAAILLATGRKRRGQTVALGPFLALGGGMALLYSAEMLRAFHALARLL